MRPMLAYFLAPTKTLQSYGWACPHPRYRVKVIVQVQGKVRDDKYKSQTLPWVVEGRSGLDDRK
jgi:hypothetical protein